MRMPFTRLLIFYSPKTLYMKKTILLLLVALFPVISGCKAQSPVSEEDKAILSRFFEYASGKELHRLPVNERIVAIGQFFINTPYKSGTLEINPKEQLVVNLREFDCVTFTDNVLALALLKEYTPRQTKVYLKNLQKIRYRDGEITDYTARLHYSTDWLYEMSLDSIVKDVTLENGGIPFPNKVGFISRNWQKYPALKQDSLLAGKMLRIENNINLRKYHYIPKDKVSAATGQIQPGDILLITTDKKGLDTAHVGIAIEQNGQIYLLHASLSAKKVVISEVPLPEYLQGIRSHSGIIIARPYQF